jgi:hypothetical protein
LLLLLLLLLCFAFGYGNAAAIIVERDYFYLSVDWPIFSLK